MKACSASTILCYIIPLFGVVSAANLRRNPDVTIGLGSTRKADNHRSDSTWHSGQNSKPEYQLTLQNYKGVQYFAPITLANQKLQAVYDTGSFEVMAMSTKCTVCKIPETLIKYDSGVSDSFVAGGGMPLDHNFAGGRITGRQDWETMTIGDLGKDFTVEKMPFWQVTDTNMLVWMNRKGHFSAIVGMGHRAIVPDSAVTPDKVESLLERTDTQRFAICLQRGFANPGYITFNPAHRLSPTPLTSLSSSRTESSMFRRVPVIGNNHWAVTMNAASSFPATTSVCGGSNSCLAIVDSGTSLIGVPSMGVPLVAKIITQIKRDCSNLDDLPDLVFELAGQRFALPPAAYVLEMRGLSGARMCRPAFTGFNMMSVHGAVWILGMPFLRHFYTVFDRNEPSLYIADQGANCKPVTHNATMDHPLADASFATHRVHQEPTMADISEARLPSWAYGNSLLAV